jgi:hypothetical protein
MQRNVGTSGQDINVAFGRGMTPISTTTPTLPGATTGTTQSIDQFIQSKAPTTSVAMPTAPSMFSPENVRNQLELERLRLQPTPEPPPEEPVAGFAQGGLVNDDINRMLQNQRNAIQRESQSRQMLTNLGAPPVKKFSDGGPAGSSSGVRRLKMSGYQEGGDVTDEMFVGTAPSEESQQTTGEYIKGLYKENIPVHARVYLETLLGKKDPITAEDFTKEELADIEKLLSSKPAKGAVTEYSDYEKVRDLDREGRHSSDWLENLPSVGKTLGRFTYETLPDGRRVIKDTYDFYNTSRSINVQEFEEMGPAEKALAVFKKITANRSMMDPPFVKRAADVLGEAYIGRDGRPVKVEYDPKDLPVKRQEGSPPEGEVNENPYVRMAREERAAQDKAFDSVNRQLSDLLERYKEGNEGITEKDLLPFFPGYNEYDIAQMYGTTTESSVPSMSSKARSFTPEIMSNLRKHDELMQKDFDRLVKEKRLPRDVITARTLGLAKGGEVTNDEFIQEMMTGTRPSDFPETSPVDTTVSDYIKFQSKAVTDPKAYMQALGENIKKYHTDPLQQDPQKYLMEQLGPGQGLMGAIKPRGGIMPTTPGTPWGEYIDEVVGAAQKSYANIASDRREGVVDFIKKKLGKYIRSDFGTEEDPLRRAIESGRLETFGKDKDTFRSYALKAAREGDPDAVFDVTKAYDIGTGIRPTVMLPTRDFGEGQLAKQKAVDDLVSKIVAEGGDPEIARSMVERQLRSVSRDETDKVLQTGEEGYSKVLKTFGVDKNRPKDMGFFERALDQGDIAYGKDFLNLQFLRPQDLAEALGAIPSNKLASMDFPEAVVEGNRLMKKSRDLDENIKIAEKGKGSTLPKEILFFGTKPLKTPAKSGQWINITDPDAARLEGALMRHSVHGYGKEGPYGLGGKQALLSGKANLFSLRDEKGLPMVTVEMENMAMQKMSDREALKTPDFKVRQVQGKFNSAPEDYIDDVFDLAETINGRWSEGPAGNQRYGKDRSGKDLDEPKIIEWGKLFANRKAQGKAAGGEITKFIKDNR